MVVVANVVGMREVHYTNQNGKAVDGRTLYVSYSVENTEGEATSSVWLSDSMHRDKLITVGDQVRIYIGKGATDLIDLI